MAERCMEIRGNPGQYTQSPFWSRPSEIVFECAVPYFDRTSRYFPYMLRSGSMTKTQGALRLFSSAGFFNNHERNIVGLRNALREILNGLEQLLLDGATSRGGLLPNDLEQPLLSEHFSLRVLRVGQ